MSSIIGFQPNNDKLKEADQYFESFLKTHSKIGCDSDENDAYLTLKGDHYFSRFSLCLIDVDSVEITDAYGSLLRELTSGSPCRELESREFGNPGSFQQMKKMLEKRLKETAENGNRIMKEALCRILLSGGKRLRPALAWTTYNLTDGNSKYPVLPLMAMIELMHTASLIHDDVVDGGMMRRGVETINKTGGNRFAVRAADFILGRAMELLKIYKGSGINERLAQVSEQMCVGELTQLKLLNTDIDVVTYKSLIEKKTARFIEAAAACGGIASGMDSDSVHCLELYGYNIGMAFQIKDDILDYTGNEKFGKPRLQDQNKGLKTLPQMIGFQAAETQVREYSEKAISAIQGLRNGKSKNDLIMMAKQLEKRDY